MFNYRLDRNTFKAQTFEESANHAGYYRTLTWQEGLQTTTYLKVWLSITPKMIGSDH
jgi:hypothetical protein